MAKPKKAGGPKQQLSPIASRRKARRDILFAKTADRKAKKAENQRIGQNSTTDIHHVKWCFYNSKGSYILVPNINHKLVALYNQ